MIKREVIVTPTHCELAEAFCDMGAIHQVAFFIEVSNRFRSWGSLARDSQIIDIGKYLKDPGSAEAVEWLSFILSESL